MTWFGGSIILQNLTLQIHSGICLLARVSHQVSSNLCYWLINDTGKLISKSSVKHVICDNYLNEDKKKQIKDFNRKLDDLLNDENFTLDKDGKFDSMYLEEIDDDPVFNPGVTHPGIEPMEEDYGDMITDK